MRDSLSWSSNLSVMGSPIISVSMIEGSPPLSARVNPLTNSGGKVYLGLSHHALMFEADMWQHR